MKHLIDTTAPLHAGTPDVAVVGSAGAPVLVLRFLRHPDAPAVPARILQSRAVADLAERTGRQYGCRPLRDEAGRLLPDAVTVTALSGQGVMLHTADGDTIYTFSDIAGRPLWSRNAQGTVNTFTYEPAGTAGRQLTLTEVSTDGIARVRDRLSYAAADDADAKARNLAGTAVVHGENAGLTETLSVALTGQSLKSEQRLLPADAPEPDWSAVSQPVTEVPLAISGTYDATGAPLSQTNAAGVTTFTAYDVSGAVREIRVRYTPKPGTPAEEVVTLRDILYRADGVVLSQTAGNGITEEYEYDSRTQYLTRHSVRRPASHPAGALLLSDLHYGYDPAGNILTLEDKGADLVWHNNQQATGLRTYGYDTLYRLTSATGRERVMRAQRRGPLPRGLTDPSAGSAWSPYEETWQYDDGDNLIKQTHSGVSGWTRATAVSSRSNRGVAQESGQAQAADPHGVYLAGGLRKELDDGRSLAWYADGQLSHVTPVSREADEQDDAESYRYADPGTRVRKVRVTKVAGGTQTAVTTYAGGCEMRSRVLGNSVQLDISVTEAGGLRVIHDVLKGEVLLRYSFADHLGSVSGETDNAGNVTSREEYYPYGSSAGSDEEAEEVTDRSRRYSGKERDATGLLYYGWRYYQAESGRWLSADPGGLIDGVNLFRYCRNNPVNIIDTDGMMPSPPPVSSRPSRTLAATQPPPIPSRPMHTLAGAHPPPVPSRSGGRAKKDVDQNSFTRKSTQVLSEQSASATSLLMNKDLEPLIFIEDMPPAASLLRSATVHADFSSRYETLLINIDNKLVIFKDMESMFQMEGADSTLRDVAAQNEVFAWKMSNKLRLDLVPMTALAGGAKAAIVSQYIPNKRVENFYRPDTSMHVFDFLINARDRSDTGGNVLLSTAGEFKAIDHESILEADYCAIKPEDITEKGIDAFLRGTETKDIFLRTDWSAFYDEHTHPKIDRKHLSKKQFLDRTNIIRNRINSKTTAL
ncbi:hypothetical protein M8R90_23790 [Enterobacter hormaechei]|nr:hypothetical protein [Enterobacter hormaechei]